MAGAGVEVALDADISSGAAALCPAHAAEQQRQHPAAVVRYSQITPAWLQALGHPYAMQGASSCATLQAGGLDNGDGELGPRVCV